MDRNKAFPLVALAAMAATIPAIGGRVLVNDNPTPSRRIYRANPKLNRSRHYPYASTYQQARDMSPSTKPVR